MNIFTIHLNKTQNIIINIDVNYSDKGGDKMQKKGIFIFLLLIIGICAVSTASAADDVDALSSDESSLEEISADLEDNPLEESDEGENLAVSQDSPISKDASDEELSVVYSSWYTINLQDYYEISSTKRETISFYMEPCYYSSESYHFYLRVVDLNGNTVLNKELKGTETEKRDYHPKFDKNTIAPGTYVLGAVNYDDNVVMDTAVLRVTGTATISANNYDSNYNSGAKMTVKMTAQTTGNPITSSYVSVKFTNTKTKKTVTKKYLLDSNGQASFIPPVGVGTWTVQYSSADNLITANTVQKTAIIRKSAVKIQAYNVLEYKGYKTTLKAKVTTAGGKKVNEGKVFFRINGKTFNAPVKNGVASKQLKIGKVKTYTYVAKFKGANYKDSKAVKAKAVLKKPIKTKIIFSNKAVYTGTAKKVVIKVLTADGRKVKDGKIKIRSLGQTTYGPVKNGKALAYVNGLNIMKHFKGFTKNGETYKRSITNKVAIKYMPASHKFKSSVKAAKVTSKFKCPCGKTSTHYHYTYGYYYTYKYKIAVV